MLTSLLLNAMEKALNGYLALDPESQKRLTTLENKTITIELIPANIVFQLRAEDKKICLSSGDDLPAAIKIRGTPINMLGLALTRNRKQGFFANSVTIEGDAEIGQQITDLFDHIEIDWEEYLSRAVGDTPAHGLSRFTQNLRTWGKELQNAFAQNINEYVHEEKPWFPPQEKLQHFFSEIDELRMDVDRLEARIKHIHD